MSFPSATTKILVLLAAVVLSVAAGGGAVYVGTEWLPRVEDPAGHGLAAVYSLFAMGLYVVIAAIIYGVAIFRSGPELRLKRGLWALLVAPLFILIFGLTDVSPNLKKELFGAIRLVGPLWVVAAVQWVILRWYMGRTTRADT